MKINVQKKGIWWRMAPGVSLKPLQPIKIHPGTSGKFIVANFVLKLAVKYPSKISLEKIYVYKVVDPYDIF